MVGFSLITTYVSLYPALIMYEICCRLLRSYMVGCEIEKYPQRTKKEAKLYER